MRAHQVKLATWGPGARVFGLLWCQECGCNRPFTSSDAHCSHVTDAECDTCGFVYGRIDIPEVRRGAVGEDGKVFELKVPARKRAPVIGDDVAAAAEQAWQSSIDPSRRPAAPPRPAVLLPDDGDGDSGSRVSSYKRSLKR